MHGAAQWNGRVAQKIWLNRIPGRIPLDLQIVFSLGIVQIDHFMLPCMIRALSDIAEFFEVEEAVLHTVDDSLSTSSKAVGLNGCKQFPCLAPFIKCMLANSALVKRCMLLKIRKGMMIHTSKALLSPRLNNVLYCLILHFAPTFLYKIGLFRSLLPAFAFLTYNFKPTYIWTMFIK